MVNSCEAENANVQRCKGEGSISGGGWQRISDRSIESGVSSIGGGGPPQGGRREGRGFAAPSEMGVHDESCPYLRRLRLRGDMGARWHGDEIPKPCGERDAD